MCPVVGSRCIAAGDFSAAVEKFKMDLLFIGSLLFQEIFHTKNHGFRATDKIFIHLAVVNKLFKFSEFYFINLAKINGRFCPLPAQDIDQAEAVKVFILDGFQFFKKNDGSPAAVAKYQRKTAARFGMQGGFDQ